MLGGLKPDHDSFFDKCYHAAMIQVSVIIPTYNRSEILGRAIHSVLGQKEIALELLIMDDGSTDGTREMVLKNFPQAAYYYQENQGPAAARNHGIEKAKGDWIAFLDSDDEWLPGKLASQLDFFNQNPSYRICQTEELWIRNGRRVNPMKKHQKHGGWIFSRCLPLCIVSPSAVMLHREVFEETGLFDAEYPVCEDYELWLRIAAKFPIGLVEKPGLLKYGGHEDQLSHKLPAMDQYRIRALDKIIRSGRLNPQDLSDAKAMRAEKIRIYAQGARKRGLLREAEQAEALLTP